MLQPMAGNRVDVQAVDDAVLICVGRQHIEGEIEVTARGAIPRGVAADTVGPLTVEGSALDVAPVTADGPRRLQVDV